MAHEAIFTHQNDLLIKDIKLASEVIGDFFDIFRENVEGKEDVTKDINIYIQVKSTLTFLTPSSKPRKVMINPRSRKRKGKTMGRRKN